MFPFRIGFWEFGLLFVLLPIYFIPTIIAVAKRSNNQLGIVLLNIFGGWTTIGWIIALVWSIADKKRQ